MRSEIEALKDVIEKPAMIKLKSTASFSSCDSSATSPQQFRKVSTESIKSMMSTTKLNEKFTNGKTKKKNKKDDDDEVEGEEMMRRGSRYAHDDDKFTNKIDFEKKDNEYSSSSSLASSFSSHSIDYGAERREIMLKRDGIIGKSISPRDIITDDN